MLKEYFLEDTLGKVHVCRWEPEGEVKAIVQIVHGIAEYAKRYAPFAEFLTKHGFLVVAEDHLGHGETDWGDSTRGYFSGGWYAAVEQLLSLKAVIQEEFPDVPYIYFGHSMGSFMVRTLLADHPECRMAGCVICGTGWMPKLVLKAGRMLCMNACKRTDERLPNPKLQKLVFGGYNKKVEHPRTEFDWLSRDKAQVDAYIADPLCGFVVSSGLLRDMLTGMIFIQEKESLQRMKKEIPILFIAGGDDPVGSYGKGVQKAVKKFKENGMNDVSCTIYPLCRHEILNEINRQEVFEDVLQWCNAKIQ